MAYYNTNIKVEFITGNSKRTISLDILTIAPSVAKANYLGQRYIECYLRVAKNLPSEKYKISTRSLLSNIKQLVDESYIEQLDKDYEEERQKG